MLHYFKLIEVYAHCYYYSSNCYQLLNQLIIDWGGAVPDAYWDIMCNGIHHLFTMTHKKICLQHGTETIIAGCALFVVIRFLTFLFYLVSVIL